METKDCWSCGLVALGGDCFPGRCRWFQKERGAVAPKDIPPSKMDVGCNFWQKEKWPLTKDE